MVELGFKSSCLISEAMSFSTLCSLSLGYTASPHASPLSLPASCKLASGNLTTWLSSHNIYITLSGFPNCGCFSYVPVFQRIWVTKWKTENKYNWIQKKWSYKVWGQRKIFTGIPGATIGGSCFFLYFFSNKKSACMINLLLDTWRLKNWCDMDRQHQTLSWIGSLSYSFHFILPYFHLLSGDNNMALALMSILDCEIFQI